jgi:hypothetical protein
VLHIARIALVGAAIVTMACQKSSERERRETERAIADATKAAAQADEEAAKKTQTAERKVAAQATEFLAVVNREKADSTYKLHVALDSVDKRLGELDADVKSDGKVAFDSGSKHADEIQRLITRRDALRADLDGIETAAPHEWPALKARIDRDIGRPRLRPIPVAPAPTAPITQPPPEEPGT